MKVNSIAGITCHVEDLARAAEFYETIGFRRGKEESDRVTFYVNWFFVTLVAHDQAEVGAKGAGLFIYIKVDDVEGFHKDVLSKGLDTYRRARASALRQSGVRTPGSRWLQHRVLPEKLDRELQGRLGVTTS
jgi:catechol 2,3-dioxygenase-like lactoylglutathione lyase family enzyme